MYCVMFPIQIDEGDKDGTKVADLLSKEPPIIKPKPKPKTKPKPARGADADQTDAPLELSPGSVVRIHK